MTRATSRKASIDMMIEQIKQHPRGITLARDGTIPYLYQGYFIGTTNIVAPVTDESRLRALLEDLTRNPLAEYVGTWYSEESKSQYLDATVHLSCRQDALHLARMYNQEAIYDIGQRKCILLKKGKYEKKQE